MNRFLKLSVLCLAISFLTETLAPNELMAQGNSVAFNLKFRTVALTGEPVADLGEGVLQGKGGWPQGFGNVTVDSNGNAAFQGGLKAKGIVDSYSSRTEFANDEAFFLETKDGLKPLLRKGDAVLQDKPDLRLTYAQNCYSGEGNVIVLARLSDKPRGGNTSHAVFTNVGGEFRPILKTGDPAIDVEGTFSVFEGLNSDVDFTNGILTFRSAVLGVPDTKRNPVGLWNGKPDALKLLALTGQPAPGMDADIVFAGFSDFKQNTTGQVVFSANCKASSSGGSQSGIWLATPGEPPKLIVKKGDVLAGLPEGVKLDRISSPEINDAGQILAYASCKSKDDKPYGAILFADGNGVRTILQTGQTIPRASQTVGGFKRHRISPSGLVAVQYLWTPESERGFKQGLVFMDPENAGSTELIAEEKSQASGAAEDVTFGPFGAPFSFVDNERIVFTTTGSDRKSYAYISTRGGAPKLIAHQDMEIEVSPGDKRIVRQASLWSGISISATDNVAAYLPFSVRFKDRSCGMLVAEVPRN